MALFTRWKSAQMQADSRGRNISSLGWQPVTCNCHDYLGALGAYTGLSTLEGSATNSHFQLQSNPYGIKDTSPSTEMSAWTSASLQSTTGYYSYDPTLAAYG